MQNSKATQSVKIEGTEGTVNQLIIAAKVESCDKWERLQEDLCSGMSLPREDRVMNRVAKTFGVNPMEFENHPYNVFIKAIWEKAKNYSITVITS